MDVKEGLDWYNTYLIYRKKDGMVTSRVEYYLIRSAKEGCLSACEDFFKLYGSESLPKGVTKDEYKNILIVLCLNHKEYALEIMAKELKLKKECVRDYLVWKRMEENRELNVGYKIGEIYEKSDRYDDAKKEFLNSAERGDSNSQLRIGLYYYFEGNVTEGKEWIKRSASQNNKDAELFLFEKDENGEVQYKIGLFLSKIEGFKNNVIYATNYMKKSANLKNSDSKKWLDDYYFKKTDLEAKDWFVKRFEDGDERAKKWLDEYYSGKDDLEAKNWFDKRSEEGDERAKKWLDEYYSGKDDLEAKNWFDKRFEEGDERAKKWLDEYYFGKDDLEAKNWFDKRFEEGDEGAKKWLDDYYFGKTDFEAKEWFEKRANQDDSKAQFWLGLYYYEVSHDIKNAKAWFEFAYENEVDDAKRYIGAISGDRVEQYELGRFYMYESNLENRYSFAVELFKSSSDQGNADAQFEYARCFELGYGVEKNLERATELYISSSDNGCESATERLLKFCILKK